MAFEPFTPRVAALLTDGRTRDTSYGNDVAPSVGIYDDDTGYEWLRLFQAEANPADREYEDGPRYAVMVDASNELGCMTCLIVGAWGDSAYYPRSRRFVKRYW